MLGAVGLATALLLPVPASPASAAGSGLVALSVSPGAVAVDGMRGAADITVSVTLRAQVGTCMDGWVGATVKPMVFVSMTRTAGTGVVEGNQRVVLPLVSGSSTDGTWSTSWRVASTFGGTWTVTRVAWCTGPMDGTGLDPRQVGMRRAVVIAGTHAPRVSRPVLVPDIVAFGAPQWATARYVDGRGRPLAHRWISAGYETNCGVYRLAPTIVRMTDANGVVRIPLTTQGHAVCFFLTDPQADPRRPRAGWSTLLLLTYGPSRYERLAAVTASVGRPTVIGHTVRVRGVLRPTLSSGLPVTLLRRVGRSWVVASRGVTTWTSRPSTGARIVYSLPLRVRAGTQVYRVIARTPGYGYAPTSSPLFRVTGASP